MRETAAHVNHIVHGGVNTYVLRNDAENDVIIIAYMTNSDEDTPYVKWVVMPSSVVYYSPKEDLPPGRWIIHEPATRRRLEPPTTPDTIAADIQRVIDALKCKSEDDAAEDLESILHRFEAEAQWVWKMIDGETIWYKLIEHRRES